MVSSYGSGSRTIPRMGRPVSRRPAECCTLGFSGAAEDFVAQSGVPASVFPRHDGPVADIVSPIWHNEKERDNAGEPGQLVRHPAAFRALQKGEFTIASAP